MERKYTLLAILLIVMALGLVILPKKNEQKETDPKVLLSAITEKSRFLTVDQVTHRIIEGDPTLMLVDLRSADQFKTFALPGSFNLHPDSLLSNSNLELFNQPGKDKVMFGNSDLLSENAWLLCSRYSINRVYIMKGGMNEWFNTIIKEKAEAGTPSSSDLDLLNFRKAARQFFIGSGEVSDAVVTPSAIEKIQVIRKEPKATSGGGC
ncbi:MAG: rhodanese-like domain-containing protein [Mariniphaga sp.]|nr:rhodanese-like domain-containing protein [Mariniphaga sp.]